MHPGRAGRRLARDPLGGRARPQARAALAGGTRRPAAVLRDRGLRSSRSRRRPSAATARRRSVPACSGWRRCSHRSCRCRGFSPAITPTARSSRSRCRPTRSSRSSFGQDRRALADDGPARRGARAAARTPVRDGRRGAASCWRRRSLIGTPILSLLGAIGAALTLGSARRAGACSRCSILPLYVPVLIFGAGAVDAARTGLGAVGAPFAARRGIAVSRSSARRSRPPPPCASRSIEPSHDTQLVPATRRPPRSIRWRGRSIPWFAWAAAVLAAVGLVHRARRRADGCPAGRRVPDHLHPRARRVDEHVPLRRDGGLERRGARLQHAALGDDGAGDRADRRADDVHRARGPARSGGGRRGGRTGRGTRG